MTNHTPGPWEVSTADMENTGDCDIYSVDGDYVAVTVLDGNTSRRDANAYLIAAAPDLLAALKRVISPMAQALRVPHDDGCGCVVHEALDAIAKAEAQS